MPDPTELLETFQTFGDLLKYLRRRAQLTQSELSIAVGYSVSQISRLEHNLRAPDRASLLALFVPALDLQDEPETVRRLLELAELNRGVAPPVAETTPTLDPQPVAVQKPSLPTGVVTFLFTDIQGSVALWERDAQSMQAALETHDALLRNVIAQNGGVVFKAIGDALQVAFSLPVQALQAALQAQYGLAEASWGKTGALLVRMGLHSGPAEVVDGDYAVSHVLNRAGRVMSAGHGGQILISAVTAELLRGQLPEAVQLLDLGEHRLRGFLQPERIFQALAPGLPHRFPPLITEETASQHLPAQLSRFIGREKELAQVKQLLQSGRRLVTLSGPGGCGKTRLALEVGGAIAEAYPHGVWLVELAPISDPQLISQAVASALGLVIVSSRPLLDLLVDFLRTRQLLLILDNCEHVVEPASRLAEALLRACPKLNILATSREPLSVPGEAVLRVPALSLPPVDQPTSFHAVERFEAVQLFVERARNVFPVFMVTDAQTPALVQICRGLDGLPLAIELAAARVNLLSLEQIAGWLDQSLALLTRGPRTAEPRHRTLQATIEWGYLLLAETERTLLRRLAVFANGWTLDTAAQVCARDDPLEVLDILSALADKSLVLVQLSDGGETRYRLQEVVRQYLLAKLVEAGEEAQTRARYLAFYTGLAQAAEPALRGPEQLSWLKRLDQEYSNLRSAISLAEATGDAESALRLAGALAWYWDLRGFHQEGLRWLTTALQRDETRAPSPWRAKALLAAGMLEVKLGDLLFAGSHLEESLSIYRSLGDTNGSALVLNNLAVLAWHQGNPAKTFDRLEQSLALLKETGDPLAHAEALFNTARNKRWHVQDLPAARSLLEQSIALAEAAGDRIFLALLRNDLAWYDWDRGDFQAARERLTENIEICRQCGDRQTLYWTLSIQAYIATYQGQFQTAREALVEMRTLAEFMVSWNMVANARQQTGLLDFFEGDLAAAQAELDAAISLLQTYSPNNAGWAFSKLGDVLLACGNAGRSAALQAESLALLEAQYSQVNMPSALRGLGNAALALEDLSRAKAHYRRGLEMVRRRWTIPDIPFFLESLAQVEVKTVNYQQAASLLGASQVIRRKVGLPIPPVEKAAVNSILNELKQALGPEVFASALATGEALSAEQAVDFALERLQ